MPRKDRSREWLGAITLLIYGLFVLAATMWPTPLDQGYGASIERFLSVLHRNGVPQWFGYHKLEFSANILMFVPIGFLVTMLLPARVWWLALVICPGASALIEFTQSVALSARFATVIDVLSNSIGALIGVLLAVIVRALVYRRDQRVIARALWLNGIRV